MRRSNFTWACLATLATGAMAIVPLAGCGRNTGLTLKILTPPDSDPFASANTVVLTLQGDQTSQQQTTATVTSGRFEAKLDGGRAGCARRTDREGFAARRKAVFQAFGDGGEANVTCEIAVFAGARAGEEARIAGGVRVRQRIVQLTQVRPFQFGGRRRDDERPWKRRAAADACFFDGLGGFTRFGAASGTPAETAAPPRPGDIPERITGDVEIGRAHV